MPLDAANLPASRRETVQRALETMGPRELRWTSQRAGAACRRSQYTTSESLLAEYVAQAAQAALDSRNY